MNEWIKWCLIVHGFAIPRKKRKKERTNTVDWEKKMRTDKVNRKKKDKKYWLKESSTRKTQYIYIYIWLYPSVYLSNLLFFFFQRGWSICQLSTLHWEWSNWITCLHYISMFPLEHMVLFNWINKELMDLLPNYPLLVLLLIWY